MKNIILLLFILIFLYSCNLNDPIIMGYYVGSEWRFIHHQRIESQYIIIYNKDKYMDEEEGQSELNNIMQRFDSIYSMVYVKSKSEWYTRNHENIIDYRHVIHYMIVREKHLNKKEKE